MEHFRGPPAYMPGIILNTLAESYFPHHFYIISGSLLNSLGFHQLTIILKYFIALQVQISMDFYSPVHLFTAGGKSEMQEKSQYETLSRLTSPVRTSISVIRLNLISK
jgi:hypothetical protein